MLTDKARRWSAGILTPIARGLSALVERADWPHDVRLHPACDYWLTTSDRPQRLATLPVLLSTSIAIAIGCYLPFSPLAEHFGFITLDGPKYFMWLVITMLAYMGLTQTVKSIYIKRHGQWF